MASKVFTLFVVYNLVNPICSSVFFRKKKKGRDSAKRINGIEGRGFSKKRMLFCNGMDRGSNFALTRKGADLLMVFSCVNGNKLTNVRHS